MFIEKTFHYIREERSLLTSDAQCVKKTENVSVDMFLSAYAISILAQIGCFCPLCTVFFGSYDHDDGSVSSLIRPIR